jgi:hypothetical protein
MDFKGPEPADFDDVRSLNIAFLEYLRGQAGEALRRELPATLRPVVAALTERQAERLASVPFLLLSLGETDDDYWSRSLVDSPVRDLFASPHSDKDPLGRIASAALGFLWQLARRNAYATRLICGASLNWCEQLAACTLLGVLQHVAEHEGLVGPRLADNQTFWHRLLGAGLSSDNDIRRAAQLSALQSMLTSTDAPRRRRFRSAACYSSVPALELSARDTSRNDE